MTGLERIFQPIRFLSILALAGLVGCVQGQVVEPLTVDLAGAFGSQTQSRPASSIPIAQLYDDAVAAQLVDTALMQNIGLKAARERIVRAAAVAGPTTQYIRIDGLLQATEAAEGTGPDSSRAGLNLGIDLFGGRAARRQAALDELLAVQLDTEAARQLLVSNLLSTYIDLRFLEVRQAQLRSELSIRGDGLEAVGQRRNLNDATLVELRQAELAVIETRQAMPAVRSAIAARKYQIATLIGQSQPPLDLLNEKAGEIPSPVFLFGAGVPADLLRNRPEIQAAEARYRSALHELDAARAARYPSLSLSGTLGVLNTSGQTSDLVTSSAAINLPIFNQGALASAVRVEEADVRIALFSWRQAVLTAVQETETALSAVRAAQDTLVQANRAVALNGEITKFQRELLTTGDLTVGDFLRTLRDLSDAQAAQISTRRDVALETTQLQFALGLLWTGTVRGK
jgi:multidrug efflux system outer membrane protein